MVVDAETTTTTTMIFCRFFFSREVAALELELALTLFCHSYFFPVPVDLEATTIGDVADADVTVEDTTNDENTFISASRFQCKKQCKVCVSAFDMQRRFLC